MTVKPCDIHAVFTMWPWVSVFLWLGNNKRISKEKHISLYDQTVSSHNLTKETLDTPAFVSQKLKLLNTRIRLYFLINVSLVALWFNIYNGLIFTK